MKRILIANRGEIASRIIRTCEKMGIETVAVYSEADAEMPFVKQATVAHLIGPAPVNQSYLNKAEILRVAKEEQVDAIHPGYGFLSENAEFVREIEAAGIRFIGPSAETIDKMGDKIASRETMKLAGVPVVPGTEEGLATAEDAVTYANSIGYPVMLKASGGGGGIGMVKCENEQTLAQQFTGIKTRAKNYFGNDAVFVEKFVEPARHIEVQIFGDATGNVYHLFERNCSVQRRNQKVIEEAPSPALSDATKAKLYEAAVKAAQAVNYKNAGTVEFIMDADENFYFLEMNTRLQVEHPITELITGQDLVEWQLLTVMGNELPIRSQDDLSVAGHALEFRLYAEDSERFMPSPGELETLEFPQGEGIRIDGGYAQGTSVTPYYDPMIAKIIISGDSREQAIERAKDALAQVQVEGVKSNLSFFKDFLTFREFEQGSYATNVIDHYRKYKLEEQS
ncbi:acetyl-CoA carboxylase biotin carboxylase subunit [Chryseomicrobium aureum]|uniref:acetyl-CoA carboxylase biotin carboxylase subunit n=1 Tax=Chryseomicrobium aureum TaxID=1441723 RepID=UPI00195D897A|nr:biotin carboxylase N-terminal domain-containing protein [Chryseomicrobium aureum]MBM7705315.1 acetyl-CoA carboxylase biotin carboxylase subunit [Chryseomicrobium aureum]